VCSSQSDLPGPDKDTEVTAAVLTHGMPEALVVGGSMEMSAWTVGPIPPESPPRPAALAPAGGFWCDLAGKVPS
jgi:hypothetical protein